MAARIRSLRNFSTPVDEASRDDLVVTDVVTVQSLDAASTYAWALVFVPQGSTATFSGSSTAVSPGSFTVDLPGPYLVRLTVDASLPTESTQYVRLRALTTVLGLRLVAAGERRDTTGIIPVDADPVGWAYNQNYNLLTLEAAIVAGGVPPLTTVLGVGNTTSGKDISVTAGDVIRGPNAVALNTAGTTLTLVGGQGTGTGNGGDIALDPGTSGGSGKRGRALVDGALAFVNRESPRTAVNEGAIFVSDGSAGLSLNEPYYRFGTSGLLVPLLGGGHIDYHRDVPEAPGVAVSYEGWVPVAGRLAAIRVYMATVNTIGTYTLTVTNLATGNPCTSTATFNMNTVVANTVTTVPLTGTLLDLTFAAVDRWEVTLTSNNPGFNGEGIYFELEFLVGYGGINGQDLATTLAFGNSTGSHNIVMTSGDLIRGQQGVALGGPVLIRGGTPTGGIANGGYIELRPGAGLGGGTDGYLHLLNAAGTQGVRISVSAADTIKIDTNAGGGLPLLYNATTGKLTVPGPIDPTALIFEEAAAPGTTATEGALFVSDGVGGLTIGDLYYQPSSNGVPINISAGGTPSTLPTEVYVDQNTPPGTYATIQDALASIDSIENSVTVWLEGGGQTHTWDGTNGDLGFTSILFRAHGPDATYLFDEGTAPSLNVDFIFQDLFLDCSEGQAWGAGDTTFLNCKGNLTAWRPFDNPSVVPQTILFQECELEIALQPGGNSPYIAALRIVFERCRITRSASAPIIGVQGSDSTPCSTTFKDSTLALERAVAFSTSGTNTLAVTFLSSVVEADVSAHATTIFDANATGTWDNSRVVVLGSGHAFSFGTGAQTQQGSEITGLPPNVAWPVTTPTGFGGQYAHLIQSALPTTGTVEGDVFLSDGTGNLFQNHLYFRPPSNGTPVDLSSVVWSGTTVNATPTEIFLDGISARFALHNNMSVKFTIDVVALNTLTGDTAGFKRSGVIKRRAGAATTAIVGITLDEDTAADAGLAAADITATADTVNGSLKITVTGVPTSNVQWVAAMTNANTVG